MMLDYLGRLAVLICLIITVVLAAVGAVTLFTPSPVVSAAPETSSNCEVYATVEGVDRYACDDFARGYTCYDRAQGMTFCVLMTEEYK